MHYGGCLRSTMQSAHGRTWSSTLGALPLQGLLTMPAPDWIDVPVDPIRLCRILDDLVAKLRRADRTDLCIAYARPRHGSQASFSAWSRVHNCCATLPRCNARRSLSKKESTPTVPSRTCPNPSSIPRCGCRVMAQDPLKRFGLAGRTILVTGASGHLGRPIAEAIAAAGGTPVLAGRSQSKLDAMSADFSAAGQACEILAFGYRRSGRLSRRNFWACRARRPAARHRQRGL